MNSRKTTTKRYIVLGTLALNLDLINYSAILFMKKRLVERLGGYIERSILKAKMLP